MKIRKGDLIIFVVLVIIGIVALGYNVFFVSRQVVGNTVQVEVDGMVIEEYILGQQQESVRIETNGGYNIIGFDEDSVQVEVANCPDQICVHFGWVKRAGQTIICLPHRLIVRVVDKGPDSELDGVTF